MDYCWRGRLLVLIGTLLFAIGGLVATYGWNIWSHQPDKKKYLRKGTWDILGGTVCIALAGLLTTYGWNVIRFGEQRNNLIRAVAQELCMNILDLETAPIKGETCYRKEDGDVVRRPFPTLKTTALNAVMSSGLWDFGNQTENDFLYTIYNYEGAIGNANIIFGLYNDSLSKIIDPNKMIAIADEYQKATPEKDYFKSLENEQNEVIKLLLDEYKWAIPPTAEGKLLLLRIRGKPKGTLEREHILEVIQTADGFVKQGELIKAKAKLEEIKDNEFLTKAEQELITKGLNKLGNQLDEQKKENTELYNRSVELYKTGEFEKAREGFVKVAAGDLVTTPPGETAEDYLLKIDNILAQKAKPAAATEAQPEDTQPEETLRQNQAQEVNLKP
jgi:hypothetical protein